MASKSNIVLTRSVKKSILMDPTQAQLFEEETQQQLKYILKNRTPLKQTSIGNILSQSSCVSSESKKSCILNLRKQLESSVWVQCDNPECFKWRMVTSAELNGITEDSTWFCSMNKNRDFASCSVPEEDTEWYDRAAKRVGLCYVKTPITEGSLVWAKMTGYCKWPGVVTKDPCNQLHCMTDVDDEPRWYHVEFLGRVHTHSWVKAANVKLYTLQSSPVCKSSSFKKKRDRQSLQGGKKHKRHVSTTVKKILEKTTYRNGLSVEEACFEAKKLIDLSNSERLALCNYIFEEKDSKDKVKVHTDKTTSNPKHDTSNAEVCHLGNQILPKEKRVSDRKNKKDKGTVVEADIPLLSPSNSERPNVDMLELNFTDSLLDHTKEEKLVLDVQMYQRNERAFEHDVLRFMKRNNVRFHRLPRWQNTSVSLFQLFLAVHERGGYQKVCSIRGGWVQVYKELTECQINSGEIAKKYYRRNLYPYELYIKGKDFRTVLPSRQRKNKKNKNVSIDQIANCLQTKENVETDSLHDLLEKEWINIDTCLDKISLPSSAASADLMEILGELETTGNLCYLEDDVAFNKAKLGIDITFYDQSPPRPRKDNNIREADTASEFGCGREADESVQEVPNVSIYSHSSPEDQILHEMQALQNDIDLVAEEIDFL